MLPSIVLNRPREARELLGLILDGPLLCTPPEEKDGDYHVAFRFTADWTLQVDAQHTGKNVVWVGCGGPHYPQAYFRAEGYVPRFLKELDGPAAGKAPPIRHLRAVKPKRS